MSMQRPPSLSLNTKVNNRYTVLSIVGHGGVGTVYKVRDDVYGNVYALKETFDLSEGARVQFEREARWLEHIDHPHIPHVRQYFQWNDRLYLVMDFVEGRTAKQLKEEGRISPRLALSIIEGVADSAHRWDEARLAHTVR